MISVKKRFVHLLMGVLMVSLAACASAPTQTSTPENPQTPDVSSPSPDVPTLTAGIPVTGGVLANTEWRLVSFGEQGAETPVLDNTEPTLQFEETGQAGGSGGCNTFSTQYAMQNSTITFDPIVSTEIGCTAEGVMEQEQRYFQTLQSANRFEQIDDRLVIHSENGSALNFVSVDSSATSDQYVLRALEGQTLSVDLAFSEGTAILAVWGEDGTVLLSDHAEASSVQMVLPATQDYHILVKGRPDGSTSYSMTVILPSLQ